MENQNETKKTHQLVKGAEYREQREAERKKKGSLKDQAFSNGVFTPKSTQNVVIGLRPEKTLFEYEWAERTAPERKSASEEKTERKTRKKKEAWHSGKLAKRKIKNKEEKKNNQKK